MKIGDFEEFLEHEEPVSGYFLFVQDGEHREVLEENYLYIPSLGLDIHAGIWERWNADLGEFETDFDYYQFRDSSTKESRYTEQGSGLITCIHNYTGLSWEEIENLGCEYIESNRQLSVH